MDGVTSAIRIVDVFYVPPLPLGAVLPPGITEENYTPLIQAYGLLQVRAEIGHQEDHDLEFRLINTIGEMSVLSLVKGHFQPRVEGTPVGLTVNVQLNIAVKRFGTCFLCVYVDGEEITRAPFTVIRQKPNVEPVI